MAEPSDEIMLPSAISTADPIDTTTETVEIIAIRTDIEHTRHNIEDTLDAIKEKLNPQVLMDQAKEHAKEVAVDAIDHARDAVKDAVKEGVSSTVEGMKEGVSGMVHSATDAAGDAFHNVTDAVSNAVQSARDSVEHALGMAKDKVGDAVDNTKASVSSVAQKVPARIGGVMEGAKGAGNTVVDTVKRNPVPTALIAVGAAYLILKHRDDNKPATYVARDYDYTEYDPLYPIGEPSGGMGSDERDAVILDTEDGVNGRARGSAEPRLDRGTSAPQSSTTLLDTISQNPLPAVLTLLGATWLFMNNRGSSQGSPSGRGGYVEYLPTPAPSRGGSRIGDVVEGVKDKAGQVGDAVSGAVHSAQDKVGDAVNTAKDKVGGAVSTAKDKVSDVVGGTKDKVGDVVEGAKGALSTAKDKASQMTHQTRERVSDLSSQALEQTRKAGGMVSDTFQDNPLAYGLVALGVGAAVGLLIPSTEPENRVMGQKRDELLGRAQTAVQDIAHKVQAVAGETLDAAKTTATQEAKNQGLTGE